MDIEEGEKMREHTEFEAKTLDLLFNTLEGIVKIVQDGTRTDRERLEKILSFIDGVTSNPLGILGVK